MGISAVVCGILGLVLVGASVALGVGAFFGGVALGISAIVLGFLSRRTPAGKGGLALGVIGVIGVAGFVLMFTPRASRPTTPVVSVTAPTDAVPAEAPSGTPPSAH